jgi:hypothetical protein
LERLHASHEWARQQQCWRKVDQPIGECCSLQNSFIVQRTFAVIIAVRRILKPLAPFAGFGVSN